jgi:hypothetical protein
MIYGVIIPKSVYDELELEALKYQEIRDELGISFFEKWHLAVEYLENNPFHFQRKNKQLRTVKLDRFPFLIVYEVIKDKVYVYRLIRAQKQPRKIFNK